jgi:hypothetical protein
MVPYTIILKTTPSSLLWLAKPKIYLNPSKPQGLDISKLLMELNFTKPLWPNSHITLVPPLRWSQYEACIHLKHFLSRRACHSLPPLGGLCPHKHNAHVAFIMASHTFCVATPFWPSVGVKPNTWKSWELGVLRDFRMFRARQQGAKHLALNRSWCHWKGLET